MEEASNRRVANWRDWVGSEAVSSHVFFSRMRTRAALEVTLMEGMEPVGGRVTDPPEGCQKATIATLFFVSWTAVMVVSSWTVEMGDADASVMNDWTSDRPGKISYEIGMLRFWRS